MTTTTTGAVATTAPGGTIWTVDVGTNGLNVFTPNSVQVQLGDVITFRWSSTLHNVRSCVSMSDPCTFTTLFNSGPIVTSLPFEWNVSVTSANGFTSNMSVVYSCEPHCGVGMVGVLSIGRSVSLTTVTTPSVVAHAVLMGIAFGVLMLIGTFVSTFTLPDWWFTTHGLVQSLATVMAIAGFIVVVVEITLSGRLNFNLLQGSPTKGAHPTLGVILFSLLFAQIVLGIIADRMWRKNGEDRSVWADVIHRWSGRFIVLLSVVQIFLGVAEVQAVAWLFGVVAAWYVLWIVAGIVTYLALGLRVSATKMESKLKSGKNAFAQHNDL